MKLGDDVARNRLFPWASPVIFLLAVALIAQGPTPLNEPIAGMQAKFEVEVDRKLQVPLDEQVRYGEQVSALFANANQELPLEEFVLVVDRSAKIQASFLYWVSQVRQFTLIGATPVATGKPGTFEHFKTPLGIFLHTPANPDFRAEGTRNENGIRGYGKKGMRVFDFGWVAAQKGWGNHKESVMRLQLHATDPDILEPKLGLVGSKGCIRAPATLIQFLDTYGVLDAEYRDQLIEGKKFYWVRSTEDWVEKAGRYLVVLETERSSRPEWSPEPKSSGRAKSPAR